MVIGRILGNRYEIMEQVGGGGMSLVFRGKDIFLNRTVAIKILREQFANDDEFVARFRREAQAVASLSHENIVSIYDVGQDNNVYYLVMEMVEGKDLKQLIRERGSLPLNEIIEITKQICDAIQHAHDHKIIHRDIKPHNIIVTEQGKAKVTDFGIARAVTTATVTHTGSIMGSVHYFSPEQAKGDIADEKSDIYSLGVVLYEMITGVLPFEGDSPITVALKKINSDPVPPGQIYAGLGEALEKVVLRAMDKDKENRYESIRQLKQDLLSAFLYNRLEYPLHNKSVSDDTINMSFLTGKKLEKKSKGKKWIWGMALIITVGFLIGIYLSAVLLSSGEVAVPELFEVSQEEAEKLLRQNNLLIEVEKTIPHPTVEKGCIISQSPKGGQTVKKNSLVKVVVSEGPTKVNVPNLIDNTLANAEIVLTNHGLIMGDITRVYHNQIESGYIIHQEPGAGDEVVQGTTVNLIVSKGAEPLWVKMPPLTGLPINQVKTIVKNNELVLGVIQPEESREYAKDIVLRQEPGPGLEILQGTIVNLVVSAGPGPVNQLVTVKVDVTKNALLRIVVDDQKGRMTKYEHYHRSGDRVEKSINYVGSGFIEVYIDNDLIERRAVG